MRALNTGPGARGNSTVPMTVVQMIPSPISSTRARAMSPHRVRRGDGGEADHHGGVARQHEEIAARGEVKQRDVQA
jgi:hypothetical protein